MRHIISQSRGLPNATRLTPPRGFNEGIRLAANVRGWNFRNKNSNEIALLCVYFRDKNLHIFSICFHLKISFTPPLDKYFHDIGSSVCALPSDVNFFFFFVRPTPKKFRSVLSAKTISPVMLKFRMKFSCNLLLVPKFRCQKIEKKENKQHN